MIDVDDFPKARPYAAHGVEFKRQSGDELIADCPFTGKLDKFYFNTKTGAWHSKTLGEGGGLAKYLGMAMELYRDVRERPAKMAALAKHRGLPIAAFKAWKFGWDGAHYVLPVRDERGKLHDLRTYDLEKKQMRSTAGCDVGLVGSQELAARPNDPVYLCEGEWDAIALNWLLRTLDKPGVVLGLPGAGTFKPEWVSRFKGRDVHTLYDLDEPGDSGEELAAKRLRGVARSVTFTHWPAELPSGFDTRDWIVYGAVKRDTPAICLEKLHKLFRPNPRREGTDRRKVVVLKKGKLAQEEPKKKTATLAEVHAVFNKWLFLKDTAAIDITLACAFALKIEGPPLWLFLVGPPGSAKTAILMALSTWQDSFFTSSLTPHALISGANWQGQSDPSLIPRLNGKLLTVKDFTPVFEMRDLDQGEIFGIFRDAYDGRCGKIFGNGVERSYESSFGFIAGVTPRIYDLGEGHASLGERFLKVTIADNLQHDSEEQIIQRAIENVDRSSAMQKELAEVTSAFLNAPRGPVPTLSQEYQRRIIALARFGARIRGTVSKDFRGEHIIGRPFAEVGSRLGVQLSKLCRALAWVHGRREVSEADYRVAVKVMLDTVAQRQEDLIRAIYKRCPTDKDYCTSVELATDIAYPNATIRRMLDDLHLLQVVEKKGTSFRFMWRLSPYILHNLHAARLYDTPEELTRPAHVVVLRRRTPAKPN